MSDEGDATAKRRKVDGAADEGATAFVSATHDALFEEHARVCDGCGRPVSSTGVADDDDAFDLGEPPRLSPALSAQRRAQPPLCRHCLTAGYFSAMRAWDRDGGADG